MLVKFEVAVNLEMETIAGQISRNYIKRDKHTDCDESRVF